MQSNNGLKCLLIDISNVCVCVGETKLVLLAAAISLVAALSHFAAYREDTDSMGLVILVMEFMNALCLNLG